MNDINFNKYDFVIVGSGFAGSCVANILSEYDYKILIVEKRDHIAGNAYDYMIDDIYIHKYGPHLFHTNHKEVYDYLSKFTDWYEYKHQVLGKVLDKLIPIPFNLNSIIQIYDKASANILIDKLILKYGKNNKVSILKLMQDEDQDISTLANFVYEHIFKYYTMKQWGLTVDQIDKSVLERVPIVLNYQNGYFDDIYQCMPKNGYTNLFNNMLNNDNIDILLNKDIKDYISFNNKDILFDNILYQGKVIYTGEIDYLFDYQYNKLPYRSLDLKLHKEKGIYQQAPTINYPLPKETIPYTRISEYKLFMDNYDKDTNTYFHVEYPLEYNKDALLGNIPYYPIINDNNIKCYNRYLKYASKYCNLYLLGRLAQYQYYNMDKIILEAINFTNKLLKELKNE